MSPKKQNPGHKCRGQRKQASLRCKHPGRSSHLHGSCSTLPVSGEVEIFDTRTCQGLPSEISLSQELESGREGGELLSPGWTFLFGIRFVVNSCFLESMQEKQAGSQECRVEAVVRDGTEDRQETRGATEDGSLPHSCPGGGLTRSTQMTGKLCLHIKDQHMEGPVPGSHRGGIHQIFRTRA